VGGCHGVDRAGTVLPRSSDSLPVGEKPPEAKGNGMGCGGLLSSAHRDQDAEATNRGRREHTMFTNRKLSQLALGIAAGTIVLMMTATPFSATADSPWDDPRPNTVLADSPWDDPKSNIPLDDSPWDGPSPPPAGKGSLA
jgi:hypothetical protein